MANRISAGILIIILILMATFSLGCGSDGSAQDEPDVEKLCVAADGMSDFWVIRSDFADSDGVKSAVSVRKRILEATGAELGITTDWEKNPVYEHEIIVGKTLRENDGLHIDRVALGETGYIIKEENGKIYIAGGSDKGTALGVEYFLENFLSADTGTVEIPVGFERIIYHKYDMSLYIAGKKLEKGLTISVPSDTTRDVNDAAARLRDAIYQKTGVMAEIVSDNPDARIILSREMPDIGGVFDIFVENDCLKFESSAASGLSGCVDRFIGLYISDKYGSYDFPDGYRYFDLGDFISVTYPS